MSYLLIEQVAHKTFNMVDFINISTADGKSIAIFTSHISYIEPSDKKGCIIHAGVGQTNVSIATTFTKEEILKMVAG